MRGKGLLLLIVVMSIAGFFYFDLHQRLSLDLLQRELTRLQSWRDAEPVLVGSSYFLLYVLVTAISLPGAAVLTLAGGLLFGLFWGTLMVSFASSIGAWLAFLLSRYLFRDLVQQRFGSRLQAINDGIARDGSFYLFALRLVPIFPFFLINLLMGLTPISAFSFYWVSQLGMLAGTIVYVNAGTQLAGLSSLSGILSPALLASFALLGLFPLLARKAIAYLGKRRIYSRWPKPKRFDRNLIVIGAGAGGLVSAYIAAAVKAKVTLIEAGAMGGDCLNSGCVPSKALIRSAKLAHQLRHGERYGLQSEEPRIDFRQIMQRIGRIIRAIEPHDSIARYTGLGVEVIQGYASIVDPWTVQISLQDGGVQRLSTRSIVIATGASPIVPPLPGLDQTGYLTSDSVWDAFAQLDAAPKRLVILGGGPIGCEIAQAMARLGSEVTLLEMGERLLPREDHDVSALAAAALKRDGIQLCCEHRAVRCEAEAGRKFIVVSHRGTEQRLEFDQLLCAIGRQARLTGFGLEELGIETGHTIHTNAYMETLYPNIYAVGDVAGPWQFTHTAAHQAWYASVNALFGTFKRFRLDDRVIPYTTFIDPEVARVGLNEQQATAAGIAYEVSRYNLEELDRAITDSAAEGFVKVLTEAGSDRILGVTIMGEHAGEMLAEFVLAMKQGLGLNKILGTIHTYPSWAEGNKYAAGVWKRAHAPEKLLQWAERYHRWRRG